MRKKGYFFSILIVLALASGARAFDYRGDGTASIGIFRPRSGLWAIRGVTRAYYGAVGDRAVPGDYRGNGTASIGVFRPPIGLWSSPGAVRTYLGTTGDEAAPGDYSGDGKSDIAIFRPSSGLWAIRGLTRFYFGTYGDIPVPADFSGDGKLDPGIFRRASGLWAIRGVTRAYFGAAEDLPAPAGYRGDGRAVPAIFRPSSGLWAVRGVSRLYFGRPGDIPIPADYTGDSTAGIALFRPASGLWAIRGLTRTYFGAGGDRPVSARSNWPPPPLPVFGIEILRKYYDDDHLGWAAEAGSRIARFSFLSWRSIQPSNTAPISYHWGDYDRKLAAAAASGQTPIVIVADVPAWAGERVCGPIDRAALPAFADFLWAAVLRYSRPPYNVKHWELINEPDGTRDIYGAVINCWGRRGDLYAEMLSYAYPAIKAADPEARVLLGALAFDNCIDDRQPPGDWGEFDCSFLHDVLEHGGGRYFDYLNFHYYYFAHQVWGSIIGKTDHLRGILAGYGLSKPIICSEVGIWGDEANQELQARYVPVVYARGLAAGLEAMIWFPLSTPAGHTFEGGLIREDDLYRKPAYLAYQTLVGQLTGYRYSGNVSQGGSEGYAFRPAGGGRTRQVLWTVFDQNNVTREIDLTAAGLRVVDKFGAVVHDYIVDGGPGDRDGRRNGRIRIAVGSSPIYVEIFLAAAE